MGRAEIARYLADIRPWEDPELIRAGIRPDRRPWYAKGDVKQGVPAYEALYHHVDQIRAERLYELDLSGHGDGDNRDPAWPAEELRDFDSKHQHWKLVMDSLEEDLLDRLLAGDLLARGFNSAAPLDGQRQLIAPERWRDLILDIKESSAEGPGLAVTQILISSRLVKPKDTRTSIRATNALLRKWYIDWITRNTAKGLRPSREDDEAAARTKFGLRVTRTVLRSLRKELAPEYWRKRGRPSTFRNK